MSALPAFRGPKLKSHIGPENVSLVTPSILTLPFPLLLFPCSFSLPLCFSPVEWVRHAVCDHRGDGSRYWLPSPVLLFLLLLLPRFRIDFIATLIRPSAVHESLHAASERTLELRFYHSTCVQCVWQGICFFVACSARRHQSARRAGRPGPAARLLESRT